MLPAAVKGSGNGSFPYRRAVSFANIENRGFSRRSEATTGGGKVTLKHKPKQSIRQKYPSIGVFLLDAGALRRKGDIVQCADGYFGEVVR